MIIHSTSPLNAEPPLDRLRASFTTNADSFYVRSHGDTPAIDEARHVLTVDGLVATPLALGMAALRAALPHRTVAAVLQCAGNRRADLQTVKPTSGDPWAGGAIGHAEWTGVSLGDVLEMAGAAAGDLHVAFASADTCEVPGEGPFRYGVSIPMAKARAPDTLLAWAMNGEGLRPEHGFPLRVVVPGFAGVRSAKWLTGITVQRAPSDNHMQQRDYKLLPPHVAADTVDWDDGVVIEEMPVTSAICEPAPGAVVRAGRVRVRGYAVASGRRVTRVDVSADGGAHWQQATIEREAGGPWSWTFWEAAVAVVPGRAELVVRAWDQAGQCQPSDPADVWNFKGYLSAAWHRVAVAVV